MIESDFTMPLSKFLNITAKKISYKFGINDVKFPVGICEVNSDRTYYEFYRMVKKSETSLIYDPKSQRFSDMVDPEQYKCMLTDSDFNTLNKVEIIEKDKNTRMPMHWIWELIGDCDNFSIFNKVENDW